MLRIQGKLNAVSLVNPVSMKVHLEINVAVGITRPVLKESVWEIPHVPMELHPVSIQILGLEIVASPTKPVLLVFVVQKLNRVDQSVAGKEAIVWKDSVVLYTSFVIPWIVVVVSVVKVESVVVLIVVVHPKGVVAITVVTSQACV